MHQVAFAYNRETPITLFIQEHEYLEFQEEFKRYLDGARPTRYYEMTDKPSGEVVIIPLDKICSVHVNVVDMTDEELVEYRKQLQVAATAYLQQLPNPGT